MYASTYISAFGNCHDGMINKEENSYRTLYYTRIFIVIIIVLRSEMIVIKTMTEHVFSFNIFIHVFVERAFNVSTLSLFKYDKTFVECVTNSVVITLYIVEIYCQKE